MLDKFPPEDPPPDPARLFERNDSVYFKFASDMEY